MTIKKFFVFSIIAHAIIFSGIYFIPSPKENKPDNFFASLVSPEELLKSENKPPPLPHAPETTPLPREVIRQQPTPSPGKPVVPDKGKVTGKPLPEGLYPKTGRGNKAEEGSYSDRKRAFKPGHYGREKLFDKDIIGDIAKKDIGKPGKEAGRDNSITFDTEQYRYAGYMEKLKEKIENIWIYPHEAKSKGIYGDVRIRFTIKKNGSLGAIELVRTSGYKILDDAAMKALKDGEPYWPIPDEWDMESYTISGRFIYGIYGYYVR